jgi:hypothetical protein
MLFGCDRISNEAVDEKETTNPIVQIDNKDDVVDSINNTESVKFDEYSTISAESVFINPDCARLMLNNINELNTETYNIILILNSTLLDYSTINGMNYKTYIESLPVYKASTSQSISIDTVTLGIHEPSFEARYTYNNTFIEVYMSKVMKIANKSYNIINNDGSINEVLLDELIYRTVDLNKLYESAYGQTSASLDESINTLLTLKNNPSVKINLTSDLLNTTYNFEYKKDVDDALAMVVHYLAYFKASDSDYVDVNYGEAALNNLQEMANSCDDERVKDFYQRIYNLFEPQIELDRVAYDVNSTYEERYEAGEIYFNTFAHSDFKEGRMMELSDLQYEYEAMFGIESSLMEQLICQYFSGSEFHHTIHSRLDY